MRASAALVHLRGIMAQTPQAEPPNRPRMATHRDQHSSHYPAYLLCCAQERSWPEDDSNKKPPEVSLRRLFGPHGDPLVCAPFLDDGMIRVQLNRHHPNALKAQRKTKAAPPPFPPPLRGPRRAKLALEVREGVHESSRAGSRVHKPDLDEMHGPESLPYRPNRAAPRKPSTDDTAASSESRVFQPASSREAALGRSTGGKPGHRGGWKKR